MIILCKNLLQFYKFNRGRCNEGVCIITREFNSMLIVQNFTSKNKKNPFLFSRFAYIAYIKNFHYRAVNLPISISWQISISRHNYRVKTSFFLSPCLSSPSGSVYIHATTRGRWGSRNENGTLPFFGIRLEATVDTDKRDNKMCVT